MAAPIVLVGLVVLVSLANCAKEIALCGDKDIIFSGTAWHPDCRRYYVCNTPSGPVVQDCTDSYFEVISGQCVPYEELITRRSYCHNFVPPSKLKPYPLLECSGKEERLSIPNECTRYVQCYKNARPAILSCSRGKLYNPTTKSCVVYSELDAFTKSKCFDYLFVGDTEVCDQRRPTVHASDCSKYKLCLLGEIHLLKCDGDKVFSNKKGKCVLSLTSDEANTCKMRKTPIKPQDMCSLVGSNLVGQIDDCSLYYNCEKSVLLRCPPPLVFNPLSRSCQAIKHLTGARKKQCEKELAEDKDKEKCPAGFIGITHVGSDCRAYYKCAIGKSPELNTCPIGTVVDPSDPANPVCRLLQSLKNKGGNALKSYYISCGGDNDYIAPDPFNFCQANPFHYSITSSKDCHAYYVCEAGTLSDLKRCPNNNLFDERKEECVRPVEHTHITRCVFKPKYPECPNLASGVTRMDCRHYRHCDIGLVDIKTCPEGLFFTTASSPHCVAFNTLLPVEKSGICHNFASHVAKTSDEDCQDPSVAFETTAHKQDCQKYYVCQSGIKTEMRCPGGYIYESVNNIGKCKIALESDYTKCKITKPQCSGNKKLPVTENCRAYYHCSSNKFTVKECPPGQKFDIGTEKCIPSKIPKSCIPSPPNLVKKCPAKGLVRMLDTSNTTCTSYYICLHGEAQGLHRCYSSFAAIGHDHECTKLIPEVQQIVCQ